MNFLISSQNGQQLSQVLSIIIRHKINKNGTLINPPESIKIIDSQHPWSIFSSSCVKLCNTNNYKDTFNALVSCFSTLNNVGLQKWTCPILSVLVDGLIKIARIIDESERKYTYSNEAQNLISYRLAFISSDRFPPNSEIKYGLLVLGIGCLVISLKTDQMHMAHKIMSQIQTQLDRGVSYSPFPKSHQVLYKYYSAKVHLYHHEFDLAQDALEFAFLNCQNYSQKRQILFYLVCVGFVRGRLPCQTLLIKYKWDFIFSCLRKAFIQGNFKEFNSILNHFEEFFIQKGLYMIMKERCQLIMVRNLFSKCFTICQAEMDSKLPLVLLTRAFQFYFPGMTLMDVECLAVSLLDQGYLKGYLIHGRQVLVLSKNVDPFPLPWIVADELRMRKV